jgi:hypothetical protein
MDVLKCYDKMNRKQFSDFSVMERLREKETAAPQGGSSSLQQFLVHQQSKRRNTKPICQIVFTVLSVSQNKEVS